MSFENVATGSGHSLVGEHLAPVPGRRIRHTETLDDPNMPGTTETKV